MDQLELIEDILNKKKGLVCREFEKVCPCEASFKRMVKEMHNIFDSLNQDLIKEVLKIDEEDEE